MTEFQSGQSANVAHEAIKSSLKTMEKAKQNSVLWFEDIYVRKLFLELGYSSINQYASEELGFSASKTGDYLQLCRSFKELPKMKEKIESGELGYTTARVLAGVANTQNENGWLDFALNNSRRELEIEVKRAKLEAINKTKGQESLLPAQPKRRPAAVVPVNVNMKMTPTQFARYEKLWEQIRKNSKAPADKVEAILAIMDSFLDPSSPRGDVSVAAKPPVQIHIHHCPECEKATVQANKGELEIGEKELERAQCDCQVSRPHERNSTSIPPATRRQVLARARHKCQRPGCHHAQYLEVHHKITRSQGGSNDLSNLICLCSGCHQLFHDRKLPMVKSPQGICRWGNRNKRSCVMTGSGN